ncbi:MAG: ATP-dependent Zn protease [Phormidesmis priestleyi]|uniref:ATP-dependent Zn protease n=1 Tax=Phormidesmis priestleyi TaxID=268141 RepID=A0A2W4YXS2_9CYAN|nr:MAG: ATP-dependent Zn protease [Phormidesmis priestleyi]
MNPTTFNLLAVSVFAFMLLSLVGPLLNISPGAVAIALTGCAGALALDRFSLKGKGGNLVIDLLSSQSSEYRQRILHHEAGHFLVAHLLEMPIQSYTLSAWEGIKAGLPGLGGVVVEPLTEKSEKAEQSEKAESAVAAAFSRQQIDRYCTVWMAGVAAETQTYGSAQGGEDDQRQLKQLWAQAQDAKVATAAENADMQLRWALLQAQSLLAKQHRAYEALVVAMAARSPISFCIQQIDQHRVIDD